MPTITIEIHVHMPWGETVLTELFPEGTPVSAILRHVSDATRNTECLAVSHGKALLPDQTLHEDTILSVLPLLCGG